MEDPVIDKIEYMKKLNQLQVEDDKFRNAIRVPTEVQGISADDQLFNSLKEGEEFK